ncbi:MAG: hypothetical protein JSV09_01275 [Thermoplasmata archaeon]|nr:MAG: hypothetical protein JSV09_01275 [Thermoplasmata archaeon]
MTSDAKVYSVEETIILYYYIKNNEASNLSLEKYLICIDLVIGPNRVERLYELTKTLKPGEEVNDSIEINRDLEPGEHLFNMELLEIMGENRYLLHQSKRLVIRIE